MMLVLIPALGCDAGLYAPLVPLLEQAECRTVVAGADNMTDNARQVLGQAPDSFIVLGTSFGGTVAAHVAVMAPERVRGLVVIGSWPGAAADPALGLRRSARIRGGEFDRVVAEMAAMIAHLPGPNGPAACEAFAAMARTQGPDLMARQSDALAHRPNLLPALGNLKCPSLLLWGAHDKFVSAADGRTLAAAMPGARFVELPECGHFPSLEYPVETAAAIQGWMAEI
jgi:pimeloyl-ACP methyl ester carboxylesterase